MKTMLTKRQLILSLTAVLLIAAAGIYFIIPKEASAPRPAEELYGDYRFEKQVYMNPLSSFLAFDGYVQYYTLTKDTLTITEATGERQSLDIGYKYSEVNEQEFNSMFMVIPGALDISKYKERYQYTLCEPSGFSPGYTMYLIDGEIWLARVSSGKDGVKHIWSIYSMQTYAGALPTAAFTPEAASPPPAGSQETPALPDGIYLELHLGGKYIRKIDVNEDAYKQTVEKAIMNYMVRSAAWPAVDINSVDDYIKISGTDGEMEADDFYVFDKDGKHCMQSAEHGRYSIINDEVFKPLKELAMWYDTPEAMKVISGEYSVDALGYVYCRQHGCISFVPGFNRLSPQQVADSIEYLPVQIDTNTHLPFSPIIRSGVADGEYIIYDMDFEPISISSLPPYDHISLDNNSKQKRIALFINAAWPGKYIVELDTITGKGEMAIFTQYFFGVILPEKPEELK